MFQSARSSLLRVEGFSSRLDVFYGGLGICKLQFLTKIIFKKVLQLNFFFNFFSSKPWIRIRFGIQSKKLDLDPESMNLDPKHCH